MGAGQRVRGAARRAGAETAHVEALYRLARLHALAGQKDAACEALERIPQVGLFDVGRLRRDEAFAALRGDERDDYQKPEQVMATLAFRPGGRVVIIDFRPKPIEERPWGPPPQQKMSRDEVDAAMAEAGLVPLRVHEFLTEQFFVEYQPGEVRGVRWPIRSRPRSYLPWSIFVPSTARNCASQAGCAGQAGAVTRLPSVTAWSTGISA